MKVGYAKNSLKMENALSITSAELHCRLDSIITDNNATDDESGDDPVNKGAITYTDTPNDPVIAEPDISI